MYPLVGENETIYGYRSLVIRLHFASGSLKNYLGIEHEGDPLPGGKALDIEKTFFEFIPSGPLGRGAVPSISKLTKSSRLHKGH